CAPHNVAEVWGPDTVAWGPVLEILATYRGSGRRIDDPAGQSDAGRTVVALQLELSEQVLDRSITLAGALLQSRAIEHVHATVRIADDALLLQPAGDHVHGLARGPEHHREELLTQLKRLAPRAVMRHQQPPTTAGIHRREGETCGGTHHQAPQSSPCPLH